MTAPLRRVHLRIWLVATIVLIVIVAAALSKRPAAAGTNNIRWENRR